MIQVREFTADNVSDMAAHYARIRAAFRPAAPIVFIPEPAAEAEPDTVPEPAHVPKPALPRVDPLADYRHAYEVAIPPDMQPQIAKQIILETAQEMGVHAFDIIGATRVDAVSRARAVAMSRVADKTSLSTTQIGRIFNKDHSTVIHAVRRMNDETGQNVRNMGGIRGSKIISWQKVKDAAKARSSGGAA